MQSGPEEIKFQCRTQKFSDCSISKARNMPCFDICWSEMLSQIQSSITSIWFPWPRKILSIRIRTLWQYRLWSFLGRVTKLKWFLAKSQLKFANWCNGDVSKSAEIWLSKSIFYVKNHPNLSDFFKITLFSKNNAQFLTAHHYSDSQNSIVSLTTVDF